MRKIAVVTGSRAEYGYLKPLMNEIKKANDLRLITVATGMHLLSKYGNSISIVEKDYPDVNKVRMKLNGDTPNHMTLYLANGIKNLSCFFEKIQPDIVVALGDRSEAFAAAIASVYLNITFAHINGGDVSGTTLDESLRHSITKLAHIHIAHTKENAKRIEKMGEEKKRIFVTGALTLDTIYQSNIPNKKLLFEKYDLDQLAKTFLVVHHPITTIKDKGIKEFKELLYSLDKLKIQTVLIYPNCDAGSNAFINLIKKFERKKYIYSFKNLEHLDYLGFMKNCDLMLGNSSSGIIEAPTFKIPVLNIGNRQQRRGKSDNIIDVIPNKKEILIAIDYALNNKKFHNRIKNCTNKFGDGKASKRIVKIFKEISLSEEFIQKQITY
jgi:UDP-N-acetylglucosamine 2-epimerase (non-hydrolysing)/GDP/UDP-N,N'-diacetylbacillosamine 2-epimerase (hydrolysing)